MLRLLQRVPARRCIHTSTTRPVSSMIRGRAGLVLGASAVTAYVAWRATSQPAIALDSLTSSSAPSGKPKAKTAEPVPAELLPTTQDSTPSFSSDVEVVPAEVLKKAEEAEELTEAAQAEGHTEEQGSGGAFNPVTGEINWDCPCLGGMAHGPCGMQFREAFSCFVFSEKEPKGIECVEKFKAMQDCFREHPDVYADEIMDDDDDDELAPVGEPAVPVDTQEPAQTNDTAKPSASNSSSTSSLARESKPRTA
ncbi:hypothetical protein BDY19DRAFT_923496 [Irpex rosettiformis]|uniref:Uncharacterized protein n=1 Tax=Irpex rosettiformis TaxID=378272 RepID=A0ACB8UGI7_9APHY|nr:hypothetical protein BDY19DRAFT_923496 [Irpex rosettiformis]